MAAMAAPPTAKVQRIMTQPIVRTRTPQLRASLICAALRPCLRACRELRSSQPGCAPALALTLRPGRRAQNLIFRFLQSKQRCLIWLYENTDTRIEGRIIGFDEYMNLVLDDAEELSVKKKSRKPLGRIMLKGDCITLMQGAKAV